MIKIAVLVSGGGTNLQALIDAQKKGKIKSGKLKLVVSSKADAFALTRAKDAGIKTVVLEKMANAELYALTLKETLTEHGIDMVVLAGFMLILHPSFCARVRGAHRKRAPQPHPLVLRGGLLRAEGAQGGS